MVSRWHYLCVPPPIPRPHVIVDVVLAFTVSIDPDRLIVQELLEERIPHKLSNALHRIPHPDLKCLLSWLAQLIDLVSGHLQDLNLPLCEPSREHIDLLVEQICTCKRQLSALAGLRESGELGRDLETWRLKSD